MYPALLIVTIREVHMVNLTMHALKLLTKELFTAVCINAKTTDAVGEGCQRLIGVGFPALAD
jgi:hypothetical protein